MKNAKKAPTSTMIGVSRTPIDCMTSITGVSASPWGFRRRATITFATKNSQKATAPTANKPSEAMMRVKKTEVSSRLSYQSQSV